MQMESNARANCFRFTEQYKGILSYLFTFKSILHAAILCMACFVILRIGGSLWHFDMKDGPESEMYCFMMFTLLCIFFVSLFLRLSLASIILMPYMIMSYVIIIDYFTDDHVPMKAGRDIPFWSKHDIHVYMQIAVAIVAIYLISKVIQASCRHLYRDHARRH